MLASESHPHWAKLVKGEMRHSFAHTGTGFLLHSLRVRYEEDSSDANLAACISELHRHFAHYQVILRKDIEELF